MDPISPTHHHIFSHVWSTESEVNKGADVGFGMVGGSPWATSGLSQVLETSSMDDL